MTRVLIVILNWNGIDDTEACLAALLHQSFSNYKIIVVDNGSSDDSITRLASLEKQYDEKLDIIYNSSNKGFAGGVNIGVTYAINDNFDYVALLNNDAIPDKDWLQQLVLAIEETDSSIAVGALLDAHGEKIDSTGEAYSTWGISYPRYRGSDTTRTPISSYVFGATGGATLYKTALFKEIGLFDETFFAYYEDADISFRAQLAGHKVYYTKDAVAYHEQGATSKKIPGFTTFQTFKNLPLLFWKNVPAKLLFKVGSRFTLLYILIFGNAVKNGAGWPALRGVFASIYYFWASILWKRLKIQRNKKVSTRYIWSMLYHDLPPEQTGMRKFRKLFTGKN